MADAAAELDEGGIKRTLKDLFAGAAGGVAQVLLGQSKIIVFIENFSSAFDNLCFIMSPFAAMLGELPPKNVVSPPLFDTPCGEQEKVVG